MQTMRQRAPSSGVDKSTLKASIRAQDDLYHYANGNWIDGTEIPADRPKWSVFQMLDDQAEAAKQAIFDELAAKSDRTEDESRLYNFYRSFLDESDAEERGIEPISDLLQIIDGVKDASSLHRAIGLLLANGIDTPLRIGVAPDARLPRQHCAMIGKGGMSLPDRSFYLESNPHFDGARSALANYANQLLGACGYGQRQGLGEAVVAFEAVIAKLAWPTEWEREPDRTYNAFSRDGLFGLAPDFDWAAFLSALEFPGFERVIVGQPDYIERLFPALEAAAADFAERLGNGDQWLFYRTWLRFKTIDAFAPLLTKALGECKFSAFDQPVTGLQALPSRPKRAVQAAAGAFPDILGRLYAERYFPNEAKRRIEQLIEHLTAAYRQSIRQAGWLSEASQATALRKLAKVAWKIGYPDKWRCFEGLTIEPKGLARNARATGDFHRRYNYSKLNRPVERHEWAMPAFVINAYYNPLQNEIVFPAGILQPPFFDIAADDAANYGAIGAIIGHELSHGFDDQGRKFDADGVLRDWWLPEDSARFQEIAQRLVAQFDAYEPMPGHRVNGQLTLGENIADLSGLTLAYRAYKHSLGGQPSPMIDGWTGEQRFFLAYAQAWRHKTREAVAINLIRQDVHAPAECRVNGVVTNMVEFYEAFGVKPGDGLHKASEQRIGIW